MNRFITSFFIFILLVANCTAAVQFTWTDVNLPVEGRRYVYAGTITDLLFGGSRGVDVTRTYSNVQSTPNGLRFDVTTAITPRDGGTAWQYVEFRELTAANETLLFRSDPIGGLVGADYLTLIFANALVAPRSFEIGQRYDYSNTFTNSTNATFGGREQRTVRAELIETVATGAGSMQAAKISTAVSAATGTLMPSYGETGWYARNVGPVRLQIKTHLNQLIDVSLSSANFPLAPLAFDGTGPQITADPESIAVAAGTTAQFRVLTAGDGLTYSWTKDGVAIPNATSATLVLSGVKTADAGLYRATVTSAGVPVQSKSARLSVATGAPGQGSSLSNLSVRANAADGGAQLIAGLSLQGASAPHRMLIRGVGPGIASFVSGAARDPSLAVRNAGGTLVAENDDWGQIPSDRTALTAMMMNLGAFALDPASKDAVVVVPLSNGNYTALMRDRVGGTGLIECYDADANLPGGFSNLSARADVRIEPLIAGIVVGGSGTMKLLVRAVGPTLAHFGVGGVYANPTLRLVAGDGTDIATNDDWSTSTQKEDLRAAFASVGAFPLDENSLDAALIATVPANAFYTAVIDSSAFGGTALVEVYRLPNN